MEFIKFIEVSFPRILNLLRQDDSRKVICRAAQNPWVFERAPRLPFAPSPID
jgi:hypothetical protein